VIFSTKCLLYLPATCTARGHFLGSFFRSQLLCQCKVSVSLHFRAREQTSQTEANVTNGSKRHKRE